MNQRGPKWNSHVFNSEEKFTRDQYLRSHQWLSKYKAVDYLPDTKCDSNFNRSDNNASFGSSVSISISSSSLASLYSACTKLKLPAANKVVAGFIEVMKSETSSF